MQTRPKTQRLLFEDAESQISPQLEPDIRADVLDLMVQWMQAVAVTINQEVINEQDHR